MNDDRIRGAFRYHGAHTGRHTSPGVQMHNLKKPETEDLSAAIAAVATSDLRHMQSLYEQPLSIVGDCGRAMIIAPAGRRLIIGDLSGIESRGTAWVAGQQSKLDQWRKFDLTGAAEDEPYYILGRKLGLEGEAGARNRQGRRSRIRIRRWCGRMAQARARGRVDRR
jgi:hypothetical protein